jgi:hypothetical protein
MTDPAETVYRPAGTVASADVVMASAQRVTAPKERIEVFTWAAPVQIAVRSTFEEVRQTMPLDVAGASGFRVTANG